MIVISNFVASFALSFVGSIPPGTINLIALQIGLERKLKTAIKFSIAAALIEYPYAWCAVVFTDLILANPTIEKNLQLFAGIIMVILGGFNFLSSRKTDKGTAKKSLKDTGFRRGLVLGILNPMAVPYWVILTGSLRADGWIDLSTPLRLHSYLLGVTLGALFLLILLAYLANMVATIFQYNIWIKRIPSIMLIGLGFFFLIKYISVQITNL